MDVTRRRGPPPRTSSGVPHQQLSENPPYHLQRRLLERCAALPATTLAPSQVSVPGAVGFFLARAAAVEFAHLHPSYDGSLHVVLPAEAADRVVNAGWGERHPAAGNGVPQGTVLVFGPRDQDEVDQCFRIVEAAHAFSSVPRKSP
jgi:hypothetical protein